MKGSSLPCEKGSTVFPVVLICCHEKRKKNAFFCQIVIKFAYQEKTKCLGQKKKGKKT